MSEHILKSKDIIKIGCKQFFAVADSFRELSKKSTSFVMSTKNRMVMTAFFEPSTRTRLSFEVASKRLGAEVIHLGEQTSVKKGESIEDTLLNMSSLGAQILIIRLQNRIEKLISKSVLKKLKSLNTILINAGDGDQEHPSQALIDVYTVYSKKENLEGLKVLILGDICHSRVAHSDIELFLFLGAEVCAIKDDELFPGYDKKEQRVKWYSHWKDVGWQADVIISLRNQTERHDGSVVLPQKYRERYGLTSERLLEIKESTMIMHPGPVHKGIDIDKDVFYDNRSCILDQVSLGIFVRMAMIEMSLT